MKKLTFFIMAVIINLTLSFFLFSFVLAQAPLIQWQKCLGGTSDDRANCLCRTPDGGYIVGGASWSNDGDVTGNHNFDFSDYWIVKLDSLGNIEWQKCLGGTSNDEAFSVCQNNDGGYFVVGKSFSADGDITNHHSTNEFSDCWIVKLDNAGNISWQKSLGGTSHDAGCSVRTTFDGGCIIAGETSSNDGDVIGNHGNSDYWVVKLDTVGDIEWQKCFGGTGYDVAHTVCLTSDSGYVIAGRSNSNDGDVLGNHGNWDYWIVKLNVIGDMEWQKCFGGSSYDRAYSIKQILDGGYIITGQSYSFDGDVTGNHGDGDCWIVKINVWGDIEWQKCFGGSDDDSGNFIEQTPDNGYLVAGKTWSNDGDVIGHVGICSSGDYWVLKLDTIGNMEWQKCLGGSDFDAASFLCLAFDGGSVIAGLTESNDIDVANNHGESDYWIVKLVSFPASMEDMNSFLNIRVHPNPFVDFINIDISDKNTDVKLVNLLGQIVAETNLQGKNFISGINVPAGAYILQLQNAGKIFSKIMIKNPQ